MKEKSLLGLRVGVVGHNGAVGSRLVQRLLDKGCDVAFGFGQKDKPDATLKNLITKHKPQAVFLATSTLDKGEAARDYMLACVQQRIPVITCEKGALAHHFDKVGPHLARIGYNAAVGGGTMMLQYLRGRNPNHHETEIRVVLNGTLNYLFSKMAKGCGLGEAYREAVVLKFAEPGTSGPFDGVKKELWDALMKACVLFNVGMANGTTIAPDAFKTSPLDEEKLDMLSRENCRLIVSFSNHGKVKEPQCLHQVFTSKNVGGWSITGGFLRVDDTGVWSWLPEGVKNAMRLEEGPDGDGGIYEVNGPGAGLEATTSAMINDLVRLANVG